MLNKEKRRHRPERLKGYDYSTPGYYFVTFNTRVRRADILCSIAPAAHNGAANIADREDINVGPAPLGGSSPVIRLTPTGEIVKELIENIERVYQNARVDCYAIMPDHVHLLLYLKGPADDPPRGAGPTKKTALPQIINALKALTTKRVGHSIWQDDYYDHILRTDADLQSTRAYIQGNPLTE